MAKNKTDFFFNLMLIRHGETEENKQGIIQGQRDTVLSEKGIRQAELVASRLQHEQFTHVYTSDLNRAIHTCQIILAANRVSQATMVSDVRLRERKLGSLEGKHVSFRGPLNDPAAHGGESKDEFRRRAISFFNGVCDEIRSSSSATATIAAPASFKTSVDVPGPNQPGTLMSNKKRKHPPRTTISAETDLDSNSSTSLGATVRVTRSCGAVISKDDCATAGVTCSGPSTTYNMNAIGECSFSSNDIREFIGGAEFCSHLGNDNYVEAGGACGSGGTSRHHDLHDSGVATQWKDANVGRCPNVSLSPTTGRHRVGRYVHGPSAAAAPTTRQGSALSSTTAPKVLIVSHGGLLSELVGYFVEVLGCRLPNGAGRRAARRITPNAALSCFVVHNGHGSASGRSSVGGRGKGGGGGGNTTVDCLLIHDQVHLMNCGVDAEPLSCSSADDCLEDGPN